MRPQTAIRGVATAGLVNGASRLLSFGTHVVVTALYGLSAELDAYFVSMTVVAMAFVVLADGFDSVAVPELVSALREGNERRFREIAGALIAFASGVSLLIGLAVASLLPLAHWIAPGLPADVEPLIGGNLVRLAPYALLLLPCRAAGSILRARRRFALAGAWNLAASAATLAAVVGLRAHGYGIALSFSAGALVGTVVLGVVVREVPRFARMTIGVDARRLLRALLLLAPVYGIIQLFKVGDQIFASFLPEGTISAVSYALLLIMAPSTILALENVFMTPLAEAESHGVLLRNILDGVLILTIPMTLFATTYASAIVAVAFERGRFDIAATQMTAEALQGFAPGLPAIFLWPVLFRLYQVRSRVPELIRLYLAAFAANCLLNGVSLALGLGVRGLALATTLAAYGLVAGGLRPLLPELESGSALRAAGVTAQTAAASVVALLASQAFTAPQSPVLGLATRATVFAVVAVALLAVAPATGIREWRSTVLRDLSLR